MEQQERPALKVAIIGGGVTGLTTAYDLTRAGRPDPAPVDVTVYEGSTTLGGLASGFKGRPEWEWPLERFYHHLFTNDEAIIGLTLELGMADLLEIHKPVTAVYVQGRMYGLDSPLRVLTFPHLSLINRLRMGAVLAYLRYHPRPPWRAFDRIPADAWLEKWMGHSAHKVIWQPMLEGKFGRHFREVNLAWFWARVYKRTQKLGYYRGGFQAFVDGLAAAVRKQGVTIRTGANVQAVRPLGDSNGALRVEVEGQPPEVYDVVLSTVGPGLMQRLAPDLPPGYLGQLNNLRSMGAVVVTVALRRQLMDKIYWVNIPKREGFPFLGLFEHTNMIDPVHYGGDHLLYIGDYHDPDHRYFEMSLDALLAEFTPHLSKINPEFKPDWITGAWVHRARYAQPVPPVGYAAMIPDIRTPLSGLYFASMSQVYPWDRGTNYAVEMGREVAEMIMQDRSQGKLVARAATLQPDHT